MRRSDGVRVFVLASLVAQALAIPSAQATPGSRSVGRVVAASMAKDSTIAAAYSGLPMAFEQNQGQVDPSVSYVARGRGYTLYLTATQAVLALAPSGTPPASAGALIHQGPPPAAALASIPGGPVLGLQLVGADASAPMVAQNQLPGVANYFIGNNPQQWHTNIHTYAQVAYQHVYPGVDLVYHGRGDQVEYDFNLQPGADPHAIRLSILGADAISQDGQGRLQVTAGGATITGELPAAYQDVNGRRQPVAGHYQLVGGNQIGLAVDSFDPSKPLVIDPVLSYSTYLGGSGVDDGYGIAVDSSGNAYVDGNTYSTNFPGPGGTAGKIGPAVIQDAFVSKLNAAGTALVYSDYVGGSNSEYATGIAVDSSGDAYIAGYTASSDFPGPSGSATKLGPGTPSSSNYDAFVAKLNAAGSALLNGTLVGGSASEYTAAGNLAIDGSGDAYVAGYTTSSDFPGVGGGSPTKLGTGTPSSSKTEPFAIKLNPAGTALLNSTLFGGSNPDQGAGIAVDSGGDAFVIGFTESSDFSGVGGGAPTTLGPGTPSTSKHEAFAVKLNAAGTALLNSTLFGGNAEDDGGGIAVDSSGDAFVTGYTVSTNFPGASGTAPKLGGGSAGLQGDAFVVKLNPGGTALLYGVYLGGSQTDSGTGIAIDSAGAAYVTGDTFSNDFYTTNALQGTFGGGSEDAWIAKLNPAGTTAAYSTYLGGSGTDVGRGIAVDATGNAYVTGSTDSSNFPTAGAVQSSFGGGKDAFIARIGAASSGIIPWHPQYHAQLAVGLTASVDLSDGHVDVTAADLSIPVRGPSLTMSHTWDSTQAQAGSVSTAGQGWQTDLTRSMSGAAGSTVTYTDGTGAIWVFPYQGGSYLTPAGLPVTLTASTSGYTLTDILTGGTRTFDNQGRYTATTDSYGNSDTLTYGSSGPTSDANSGGRALTLAYTSNLLSEVKSPLWVSSAGAQGQHVTYSYTGQQLTSQTRGAGTSDAQTTSFAYAGTQLITATTGAGHAWALAYDALGRLSTITSPISGTVGQAGYTPAYVTKFTYNLGQTVVARGYGTAAELDTTYTLDGQGEVTTVQDGLGHTNTFTYDADHDILTSQDANSNTTTYHYQYIGQNSAYGQVTEIDYPAIHPLYPSNGLTAPTTHFVYDPNSHDLTERYDNFGAYTFYTYNGHHDISTVAELVSSGNGPVCHWRGRSYGYDTYGEQTSGIDGRGVTVPDTTSLSTPPTVTANGQAGNYTRSWGYTTQGDLHTSTTPPITTTLNGNTTTAPATTTYGYDGDGDLTSAQSPNGSSTVYGYDHLGRRNSTTLPNLPLVGSGLQASPLATVTYDGDGNVIAQMDGSGSTGLSSYDPLGRLVSTDRPLSLIGVTPAITGTTILTYTATELVSARDPQGNVTTYTYDAAGRRTSRVDGANKQRQYGYDNANNVTSLTLGSPANPSSVIGRTYDANNEVTTEVISNTTTPALTTTYSYDLHGNPVREQAPNNDTSFIGYDLVDQVVSQELDPGAPNLPTGAHAESFSYDPAGNRVGHTDFRGGSAQLTFDAANRQTTQLDSFTGTTPISTTAGFDPDGNLISQQQTIGSQAHTFGGAYNPADWPRNNANDGLTTTATGAGAGDLMAQSIANGAGSISYNLDAAGRANAIGLSIGGTGPFTSTFSFDNNDLTTSSTLPNGVVQQKQYNGDGRPTQVTAQNGPLTLNSTYQYGYEAADWTSAITSTVGGTAVQQLTHDAMGRLTAVTGSTPTGSWAYDGRGNLTSATANGTATTYTYSANNPEELASTSTTGQGTVNYGYDANGDTTSIGSMQLGYDAQARLASATLANGTTIGLDYNALGQRADYTVTPQGAGSPSLAMHFQYRGIELAQVQVTGTGVTTPYTDTYVYQQSAAPLALLRQAGSTTSTYYYVLDGQGNVVALTDSAGNVVDSYSYDQWGKLVSSSESVPQRLRYAGYWYDAELTSPGESVGWYWLSVREYDPTLERFLQPDPSEREGLFSYVYANDDPADQADPSGLDSNTFACLRTADGHFDCDEAVGSDAWKDDLAHGASQVLGADGSPLALLPDCPVAGGWAPWDWPSDYSSGVCQVSSHAHFGLFDLRALDGTAIKLLNIGGVMCQIAGPCDDLMILHSNASLKDKLLALADLGLLFAPGIGEEELLGKVVAKAIGYARDVKAEDRVLSAEARAAEEAAGCALCFPAGTLVATPKGEQPIDQLRAGDKVLAEDPTTAKVTAEPVLAVRRDPRITLMEIDLSDGSAIQVTADHPFWVDSERDFAEAGWRAADAVQIGDWLRTAIGFDVEVVGLRYHVGVAVVYTLTVEHDHDFFVGTARVLVHNATGPCIPRVNLGDLSVGEQQEINSTLTHIANNTIPSGPAATKWGAPFDNRPLAGSSVPELPFSPNPNYYHEYRVIVPALYQGQNILRLVTGAQGEIYYTWTHYGTAIGKPGIQGPSFQGPSFVRLR